MKKSYQARVEEAVAKAVIDTSTDNEGHIHLKADQAIFGLMGAAAELLVLSGATKSDREVSEWANNFANFFAKRLVKAQRAHKHLPDSVVVTPPKGKAH
jgi:hypothetical protein